MAAACGSGGGSPDDSVVSTVNPNPGYSVDAPTEDEMQEQFARTEAFAATVVGLEEEVAIGRIEEEGFIARVVARDGEYYAVTEDYVTTRINLVIVAGIVTEATVG
jgi:hypothetical protein